MAVCLKVLSAPSQSTILSVTSVMSALVVLYDHHSLYIIQIPAWKVPWHKEEQEIDYVWMQLFWHETQNKDVI